MLVLRSLTFGLLAVCSWALLILVDRSEPHWCAAPRMAVPARAVTSIANPVSIIDLAAPPDGGVRELRELASMIRLAPGEWIELPRRDVVGARSTVTAGSFVDFTVASAAGSRRVLVLAH